jgi:hypothetical protein
MLFLKVNFSSVKNLKYLWCFVDAPNKIFWIIHICQLFVLLPFINPDDQEFTVYIF